jgi:DNA-directed RNA polymerase specialized sigma subunit
MDYVREAIEYLKSYNDLEKAKDNLSVTIRELRAITGVKTVNLDGMPPGGSGAGFDDVMINNMYKLQVAEKNLKDTIRDMKRIESILEDLNQGVDNELHGKLLRLWFIENYTKEKIAEILDVSVRHVFRMKNIAIRRLAIQLHGINVIK